MINGRGVSIYLNCPPISKVPLAKTALSLYNVAFNGDPMTRVSKQGKDRSVSPRRPRPPSKKTGPKRDALELGYKPHENALQGSASPLNRFIPKIG